MPLTLHYIPKMKGRAKKQAADPNRGNPAALLTYQQRAFCFCLMVIGILVMLGATIHLVLLEQFGYVRDQKDPTYRVSVGSVLLIVGAAGAMFGGFFYMNSIRQKKRRATIESSDRPLSCVSELRRGSHASRGRRPSHFVDLSSPHSSTSPVTSLLSPTSNLLTVTTPDSVLLTPLSPRLADGGNKTPTAMKKSNYGDLLNVGTAAKNRNRRHSMATFDNVATQVDRLLPPENKKRRQSMDQSSFAAANNLKKFRKKNSIIINVISE